HPAPHSAIAALLRVHLPKHYTELTSGERGTPTASAAGGSPVGSADAVPHDLGDALSRRQRPWHHYESKDGRSEQRDRRSTSHRRQDLLGHTRTDAPRVEQLPHTAGSGPN